MMDRLAVPARDNPAAPLLPDSVPGSIAQMPATQSPPLDARAQLLQGWLGELSPELHLLPQTLRPASSDASFRRYFRLDASATATRSWIAMDAPPEHEDCRPFVHVAELLSRGGVTAPAIVASDLAQGFLLLADFGNTTYADALQRGGANVGAMYEDALATLVRLQQIDPGALLPRYDRERLLAEMRLFPDWYVARHLGMELTAREREVLDRCFASLIDSALAQGQVLVHRDYHCRNLMVLASGAGNPGVLDFQDAVVGPITYDLASLLRDAYIEWPEEQQIDWAASYWEAARDARLPVPGQFDVFWKDFEWMGLQRTLKVLGIFSRLNVRDGKARYLDDLPLVLRHTRRVAERYDTFAPLVRLLDRVHQSSPQTGFTF